MAEFTGRFGVWILSCLLAVIVGRTSLAQYAPVPAGGFWMGQDGEDADGYTDEIPAHWVELSAFNVFATEVTNAQYAWFLNTVGAVEDEWGHAYIDADDPQIRIHYDGGAWRADPGWEEHPMREVSWYGARAYCRWAKGRLPTEPEWEKAARWSPFEQQSRTWPWGDSFSCDRVSSWWCNKPYLTGVTTTPVGSFMAGASPCGAMDMAGNVWEWTAGGYLSYPGGPEVFAYYTHEVQRGGSWTNSDYNLRCATRSPLPRYMTDANLGFRVCFSVMEAEQPVIVVPPRLTYEEWGEGFEAAMPVDEVFDWWGTGRSFGVDETEGWFVASLENLDDPLNVAGEYAARVSVDPADRFAAGEYVDVTVRLQYERGDRDYARCSVGVSWGDDREIEPGARGADENYGHPWLLVANNSDSPGVWHEVTLEKVPWREGRFQMAFGLWGNLSMYADPPIVGQHRMRVDWVRVRHSACTSGRTDFDGDCDVDSADFGHLQACFTEGLGPPRPGCENADLDNDLRVNAEDLELFRECVTGAYSPMKPECAWRD